jgi:outer membrane lipoprotein LolB
MPKLFWLLFIAATLSGCATLKSPQSPSSPTAAFIVTGAIAAKNQQQGWTATFYWLQNNPQDYQILISGPLGSDTMEITQHPDGVTFREGHRVLHARQAEELLAKETGVRLPMHHLYYWIKGKPAPGPLSAITRSASGDIIRLQQAGYTLEYDHYRDHYPYKIRLQGHQLSVKIVIKQWDSNPLSQTLNYS